MARDFAPVEKRNDGAEAEALAPTNPEATIGGKAFGVLRGQMRKHRRRHLFYQIRSRFGSLCSSGFTQHGQIERSVTNTVADHLALSAECWVSER